MDSESKNSQISVIDVAENFFGELSVERAQRTSDVELREFAEELRRFYAAFEYPSVEGQERPFYSGGWVASNWQYPDLPMRGYVNTALIYYPSVTLHDPLAEWFNPRVGSIQSPPPVKARNGMVINTILTPGANRGFYAKDVSFDSSRIELAHILPGLSYIAPLVRAGIVRLIPQWEIVRKRQQAILSAVRYDVRDPKILEAIRNPVDMPPTRTDNIIGMNITPSVGWKKGDEDRGLAQDHCYYLNKTIAVSKASDSCYVPVSGTDFMLYKAKLDQLMKYLDHKDIDFNMVDALITAELPFFTDVDVKTLISIRKNEESFDSWRRQLRSVIRKVESSREEDPVLFYREAKDVIRDELIPEARKVRREIGLSSALRSVTKDEAVMLTIGLASLGFTGSPIPLATMSIGAVLKWAYRVAFHTRTPTGERGVLAQLMRGKAANAEG